MSTVYRLPQKGTSAYLLSFSQLFQLGLSLTHVYLEVSATLFSAVTLR